MSDLTEIIDISSGSEVIFIKKILIYFKFYNKKN